MHQCDHPLWDEYAALCHQHEQLIRISERSGTVDAQEKAYQVSLQAFNVLQKITRKEPEKRYDPLTTEFRKYLEDNPMSTVGEIGKALSADTDQIRNIMNELEEEIGMDGSHGVVRIWLKKDVSKLTDEDIDHLVRSYMNKMRSLTIDACARFLGLKYYKVLASVKRLGYKPEKATKDAASIIRYYPHS